MPSIAQLSVGVSADIDQALRGLSTLESRMQSAAQSIETTGGTLTKAITAPLAVIGGFAAKGAIDFEESFVGVEKTVKATSEQFQQIEKDLRALAVTKAGGGKTAVQLAEIAGQAGQLGIAADNIVDFTRVAAQLDKATNLSQDEATIGIAQLMNVAQIAPQFVENLASSIVGLGNQMNATEQNILQNSLRIAGALRSVGVSQQDILGIAAALTEVGLQPELAGTAISQFFVDMVSATEGATGKLKDNSKAIRETTDRLTDLQANLDAARERQQAFGRNTPAATVQQTTAAVMKYERELGQTRDDLAKLNAEHGRAVGGGNVAAMAKVAGVTADEFRNLVKTDPSKAFSSIVQGLSRINQQGGSVIGTIEELGIKEDRMRDVMLRLALAPQALAKGLEISNLEWERNKALAEENERAMSTTAAQIQLLRNRADELAISFGEKLLPHLERFFDMANKLADRVQGWIDAFGSMDRGTQEMILTFAGVAAVLGPALIALGFLGSALGALLSPVGLVAVAVAGLAALWIADVGGIQEKVLPVLDRIGQGLQTARVLWEQSAPGLGDAIGSALGRAKTLWEQHAPTFKNILEGFVTVNSTVIRRMISLWATFWIVVFSVADRVVREIAGLFEKWILPVVQSVGQWLADHIGRPLLGLLKFLGDLAAATGLTERLSGINVDQLIRQGQLTLEGMASGLRAGGPGAASNSVNVTINNPVVPDRTASEQLAHDVFKMVADAMVEAESRSEAPPRDFLPGSLTP